MSRTVSQKRAAFALKFVRDYRDNKDKEKMTTHVHKTPIRALQNGLGQALAFLCADAAGDDGKAAEDLYQKLQEWLCGTRDENHPCRIYAGAPVDLIKRLVEGDRATYLRAQEETLRLFDWLTKFADAYLA